MITYAKAKKLIATGDFVYVLYRGKVIEDSVLKVVSDAVMTDVDELFFEEHGYTWFLTKRVADEKTVVRTSIA